MTTRTGTGIVRGTHALVSRGGDVGKPKCHRWCTRMLSVVAVALVLGSPARADDRAFVFRSIDFPGAPLTGAAGINAAGDVVGRYQDSAGKSHGFLLSGGLFTTVDFPGSAQTVARGIGPGGDIVGMAGQVHGFLRTADGTFYRVDYPGHANTVAVRILPNGTILGCYHDADQMGSMHGMIVGHKGFSEFDMPATMHTGATPDGKRISGWLTDMMTGRIRGYLLDGDNFVPFDVPGSKATEAWDINPAGDIVGLYQDASGQFHGFVVDDGWSFTTIDVPGAISTRVFGINSRGDVVGSYVDAGNRQHGFIGMRR